LANPLKVSLENIIPLTEARDHFSQIVAEVQRDKLYVLTKGGKPAVAIIDVKYLETISGGRINESHVEREIQKAPEKVGRPKMIEHPIIKPTDAPAIKPQESNTNSPKPNSSFESTPFKQPSGQTNNFAPKAEASEEKPVSNFNSEQNSIKPAENTFNSTKAEPNQNSADSNLVMPTITPVVEKAKEETPTQSQPAPTAWPTSRTSAPSQINTSVSTPTPNNQPIQPSTSQDQPVNPTNPTTTKNNFWEDQPSNSAWPPANSNIPATTNNFQPQPSPSANPTPASQPKPAAAIPATSDVATPITPLAVTPAAKPAPTAWQPAQQPNPTDNTSKSIGQSSNVIDVSFNDDANPVSNFSKPTEEDKPGPAQYSGSVGNDLGDMDLD